ncbi:MAG: sxtJ [Acidiferrobacteraceae bacterium]|jgi:hypothetical protein|nr:sxtJ [Acidiferrobacteraceae bacterium]
MIKQEIPELDSKALRQFALIFAAIVVVVFGVVIPLITGNGFVWIPWAIGGMFALWGLSAPATVRPFYRLWMRFGMLMGAIVNRVVLGVVFYLILLPFGLVFRIRGIDPLRRKWDLKLESYRVISDDPNPEHMNRPF